MLFRSPECKEFFQKASEMVGDAPAVSALHLLAAIMGEPDEVLEKLADGDSKDALAAMPEEFRMAVYLADVEGFSYKEIAEIVNVPTGTVMSRLHRGRKLLRESLADYARERGFGKEPAL